MEKTVKPTTPAQALAILDAAWAYYTPAPVSAQQTTPPAEYFEYVKAA